jgi:hypothetical protein
MRKQAQPRAKNGTREPDTDKPERKYNPAVHMFGNKNAEKWTEEVVIDKLKLIYSLLTEDEDNPGEYTENPVRANSIKFQKEVCLMAGISSKTYVEWKEKFTYPKRRDYQTNEMVENPTYSPLVSELIQNISDICECRLGYSGSGMDCFILKNHYGYVDQIDHTTNGKDMPSTTVNPVVNIIQSKDEDEE